MKIRVRKYFAEFLPRNASSRLLRSICVAVAMRAPCLAPCFFGSICSCSVYRSSQHVRTFRSMRMRVSFIINLPLSPSRALSLARPLSPRVWDALCSLSRVELACSSFGCGLTCPAHAMFQHRGKHRGISQKLTIHSYYFFLTTACICFIKFMANAYLLYLQTPI